MVFNYAQMSGRFEYDANYISMNTYIRNLKTNILQLTDRIYVDKPIKKQKEVPMQRQKDLSQTFVDNKIISAQLKKSKQKEEPERRYDESRGSQMGFPGSQVN